MSGGGLERQRFAIAPDWRGRLFALLRFVLFVVLVAGASMLSNDLRLHRYVHSVEQHWFLSMAIIGASALVLIFLMARLSGRRFGSLGYAGRDGLRNLVIGLAVGIALVAAQLGVLHVLGFLEWGSVANAGVLHYAIFYAAFFLILGFTEESLFRGYTLVELSRVMSFWPAALLLAFLFGAIHALKGDGESLIGGIEPATFALITAWSFQRTGTLWLAIGTHAGWDYALSFLFGVPDSGSVLPGSLLHPIVHGPHWLTGGSIGPEGSVLAIGSSLVLAVIVWLLPVRDQGQDS
jgi:membrane protease YdiL (CAAX protease family)